MKLSDFTKGTRVELHPGTDRWMMGDRYGTVIGFGRVVWSVKQGQPLYSIRIKLDKSGKILRFRPESLSIIA